MSPPTKWLRQIRNRQIGNVSATPDANSKGEFITGLGIRVLKAAATLPASTVQTIFTVVGGRVLVTLLQGEVTTVIQVQGCNLSVEADPTVGALIVLADTVAASGLGAGVQLSVEGDGTALVQGTAGVRAALVPMVIPAGIITLRASATNTGATKWQCHYLPLDDGAYVTGP